jgi:hypothetical protein
VSSLVEDEKIESFFFIRYGLGGPHIRLRVKPVSGAEEIVLAEIERFARDFLERVPSRRSLEEDVLRRINRSILASDPHESDDSIFPDNFFQVMPFRPEIERYGGPERFLLSLDVFALSSVAALEFLFRHGEISRSGQLVSAFRLLLGQALGFAADEIELADLLRYGVDWMGGELPKVLEKGDSVARSQQEAFLAIFDRSLFEAQSFYAAARASTDASGLLLLGAAWLSAAVGSADRFTRAKIGGSQLHMTATRLGLGNAEEVYLSRLLTVTLEEARARGAELSGIGRKAPAEAPGRALRELVSLALQALRALPAVPPSV